MNVLIFGGTGTIGTALVKKKHKDWNITAYSRDEYKQAILRDKYRGCVDFIIGDVRDRDTVRYAISSKKPDMIVLASAMKRIEKCEESPSQAVLTNVIGSSNVVELSLEFGIKRLVSISTDKAVEPSNVYGMTKAIQERITTQAGYNCVRYGNVFGSRGSVVPLFLSQKENNEYLTVTDKDMTRFFLKEEDGVKLIEYALSHDMDGSIFVKPSKSIKVIDIARAIVDDKYIKVIGSSKGEKKHESLLSLEEMSRTSYLEDDGYFKISKQLVSNNISGLYSSNYNSYENEYLTIDGIKELIKGLGES
jgi:FlaA1/EpsC-like NDP-sugar epimerase